MQRSGRFTYVVEEKDGEKLNEAVEDHILEWPDGGAQRTSPLSKMQNKTL